MKRHLNTLFVTTQGAYLSKDGETVVVRADDEIKLRLPFLTIGGIVCFGNVMASPALLGSCAERGVGVTFLTENGRFLARVVGPTVGNVLLRREQYRRADEPERYIEIIRSIIAAKISAARNVLLRGSRDRPSGDGSGALLSAASQLGAQLLQLERTADADGCRGVEGMAARTYFEVFDHLVTQQREAFFFKGRSRRPPLDNVNALMSFVYTLLVHDVQGALESAGLDPFVGFLHRDRPGRPSLALDLMEELRPWFADRLVLSLVNLRQITSADMIRTESGGVQMTDEGRKAVIVAYQKRKQDEILHPFLQERTTLGMIPHIQALLLARHLRGDIDGYPAYLWK